MKEKNNKVINFYEKARIPYITDPKTEQPRPLTEEEARVFNTILREFLRYVKDKKNKEEE